MKKNPIIFSFIVSGLVVFIMSLLTLYFYLKAQNNPYEGWEGFGYGLGHAILFALSLVADIIVFAIILIVTLIAIVDYCRSKKFRKGIYIMYNVIFCIMTILSIIVIVQSIPTIQVDYPIMIFSFGVLAIVLVSFILNTKYLIDLKKN